MTKRARRLPGNEPWRDNTLAPAEVVIAFELPPGDFSAHYTYLKLRDRLSYAFALVSVAVVLAVDEAGVVTDARIALGGVAHKPWRVAAIDDAAHSAIFAEVKVDEELGVVRVTRVVIAVAAGRIINPKTARSQILGAVVMGIGMALHEESVMDHRLGRFMTQNFGDYHIPVNADIGDIEVIFVDESDPEVTPLRVKGVGEIGIVGTAAAVANAIFHATGKRVRSLPVTIDKLLD